MGTTTELSVIVLLLSALGVVCAGRGASKFYCQRVAPAAVGVLAVAALVMLAYGRLSEGMADTDMSRARTRAIRAEMRAEMRATDACSRYNCTGCLERWR